MRTERRLTAEILAAECVALREALRDALADKARLMREHQAELREWVLLAREHEEELRRVAVRVEGRVIPLRESDEPETEDEYRARLGLPPLGSAT